MYRMHHGGLFRTSEYTHTLRLTSELVELRGDIEVVITGEREKTIDNRFCDARHENKEKRREAKRPARFDYIFGRARSLENRMAQFNKIEYPMKSA